MTNFQDCPTSDVYTYSQAHILIEIELLVQTIIVSAPISKFPFHTQNFKSIVLSLLRNNRQRYFSAFSPNHKYSEHIEAFWHGCKEIGLLIPLTDFGSEWHDDQSLTFDKIALFIESVMQYVRSKQFSRCAGDRRQQTKANRKSLRAYAEAMHEKYSRLLVVRVDLKYRAEVQEWIGIDDVYMHLDALNAKKAYSDVFQHEAGSIWAIEQGETLGYHIHAVFYFKGSEHQNDWFKAEQIGLMWQEITQGYGCFHTSNTQEEKAKFAKQGKLGIGMIHRNDPKACQNSIDAVSYLANPDKVDQYLRIKPNRRKTFATGVLKAKALKTLMSF